MNSTVQKSILRYILLLFGICFFHTSFSQKKNQIPKDWKLIKTIGFEISVPSDWKYNRLIGRDSFVGEFISNDVHLKFDMSTLGYANNLLDYDSDSKNYTIKHDTIDVYARKLVIPKNANPDNLIGLYMTNINSNFDFNICADNLNSQLTEQIIMAFKSVKITMDK